MSSNLGLSPQNAEKLDTHNLHIYDNMRNAAITAVSRMTEASILPKFEKLQEQYGIALHTTSEALFDEAEAYLSEHLLEIAVEAVRLTDQKFDLDESGKTYGNMRSGEYKQFLEAVYAHMPREFINHEGIKSATDFRFRQLMLPSGTNGAAALAALLPYVLSAVKHRAVSNSVPDENNIGHAVLSLMAMGYANGVLYRAARKVSDGAAQDLLLAFTRLSDAYATSSAAVSGSVSFEPIKEGEGGRKAPTPEEVRLFTVGAVNSPLSYVEVAIASEIIGNLPADEYSLVPLPEDVTDLFRFAALYALAAAEKADVN